MLSINSDTQEWSSEIESTASRQLSIFVKIARALKLYCRYEGKQKKPTKGEGVQPAVMGRLHGDALQDDYDPMNEAEDEEFNRNESQCFELSVKALRDAQELDDQRQKEDEEEAVSTSKTTTNSASQKSSSQKSSSQISSSQRSSSQRSSSQRSSSSQISSSQRSSMQSSSMMLPASPRFGAGVKYNYKIYLSWFANYCQHILMV
jgi:type IV secretory pathway VirB10-like protein